MDFFTFSNNITSKTNECSPKVYYHLPFYDLEGNENCVDFVSQVREEIENGNTSGIRFTPGFVNINQVS